MSARGSFDAVGHVHLTPEELGAGAPVNNIVVKAATEDGAWIEEATTKVGDWRAVFRSTYFRWALSINGLHVAADRYKHPDWQAGQKSFVVRGLRADNSGSARVEVLAEWDGDTAADNHLRTQAMLVSYGIIDMAACFEEWVFDLYRCYLNQHPKSLLQGDEQRELKRLWKNAKTDPAAAQDWAKRWPERLSAWQQKKVYQGLDKVFTAFFADTGLKRPSSYHLTDIDTWAESLRLVAVLRNHLIHGADVANSELAGLSGKPTSLGMTFTEGQPLRLELEHLQAVECFTDQLLSAVNLSLAEHQDAGA